MQRNVRCLLYILNNESKFTSVPRWIWMPYDMSNFIHRNKAVVSVYMLQHFFCFLFSLFDFLDMMRTMSILISFSLVKVFPTDFDLKTEKLMWERFGKMKRNILMLTCWCFDESFVKNFTSLIRFLFALKDSTIIWSTIKDITLKKGLEFFFVFNFILLRIPLVYSIEKRRKRWYRVKWVCNKTHHKFDGNFIVFNLCLTWSVINWRLWALGKMHIIYTHVPDKHKYRFN